MVWTQKKLRLENILVWVKMTSNDIKVNYKHVVKVRNLCPRG